MICRLGTDIPMWRMPVREFHGNEAWIEIALAMLDLGKLCPPCLAAARRPTHLSYEAVPT